MEIGGRFAPRRCFKNAPSLRSEFLFTDFKSCLRNFLARLPEMSRPFFLSSPVYTRDYPKIDVLGAFYQQNQKNRVRHVKVRNFLHHFKKKIASTDLLFPYFRSKMSSRCLKGPKTRQNRGFWGQKSLPLSLIHI